MHLLIDCKCLSKCRLSRGRVSTGWYSSIQVHHRVVQIPSRRIGVEDTDNAGAVEDIIGCDRREGWIALSVTCRDVVVE